VDISINHISTNDPYLSSSIGYMARWHNGLLPKRNTWRRLGSTGLSVYHGLFNAKLLVKLWCIPLFQGKQLDVPLVVFQQIQHPLGRGLHFGPCDHGYWTICGRGAVSFRLAVQRPLVWLFLWNFFGSWRLLMIFSHTYGEYQENYLVFGH
jgi:hypothetical protein